MVRPTYKSTNGLQSGKNFFDAGCTMSDIPPPLSMIPPGTSQSYPELRYDDAGNEYARNNYGTWEPHPGV